MKSLKQIGCALVVLYLPIGLCQAQYTLTSGNSSVAINASGANSGVTSWIVNGQNQLNDQWFWYRIGSTGPEYAINTIGTPTVDLISSSILQTTYVSSQIQATILYSLVGGSAQSGTSDLSEQIAIQNLTSSSISFHFFQYADFNLGGTANNDSGQVTKAGSKYGGINQLDGTCMVSENVYTAVSQP
ncbi:MAG TPA: hypothetical protein VHG71_01890, partial [Verrucomicrobiae bacterium]|nr:hypothetical protein [Verrucomicrobiae bacterium]